MRRLALFYSGAVLVLAIIIFGSMSSRQSACLTPVAPACGDCRDAVVSPPIAVCFAEGTSPEYMAEWQRRIWGSSSLDFNAGNRWTVTATDETTGGQGDGITLTYSFVPDDVIINGSPNELFSMMSSQFDDDEELWQAQFAAAFSRWGELSGITYIQVSDDGADWGAPGSLGSRGDIRIGSIPIDGPSNVLAYNQFPNNGDMVLDADEDWGATGQDYRFLRNIAAHEHGHGLGILHVCPANSTKLMEPFYSSQYFGPQHDDIRCIQRMYGDGFEPNDDIATAHDLGTLTDGYVLTDVSLDDNGDLDFYRFTTPPGMAISLSLVPVGFTYLDGTQNQDGSCSAGSEINSVDDNNLNLYLLDESGTTTLANAAGNPPGQTETLTRYVPTAGSDEFILRIDGATSNQVQLYELRFGFVDPATPILSGCPVEFGDVWVGESRTESIRILNPPQGDELSITSITSDGPFTASPSTPTMLEPAGVLNLDVTFHAQEMGIQTGTLTVQHTGPGGPLVCELTGKAISVDLQFLTANTIDFGEVQILTTDSVRVAFRAVGNTNLIVQSVATLGSTFSVHFATPLSLPTGPLANLYPRFTPTGSQLYEGSLIITHTGTSSPDTISLTGTGTLQAAGIDPTKPYEFALTQNYPNPFNPNTTISFSLPHSAMTRLQVYDLTGRLVRTLIEEDMQLGNHSIEFQASDLPSGVYLYCLTSGGMTDTKKLILLK
jgi:hypothetical protein